ncbi:MAG: hypothetical protein L0154_24120 [Chloroflexi bacterium]|nr:hypothetical protein [Chloroflexota bacterium]
MSERDLSNEERERYIRLCQAGHVSAMQNKLYEAHFYFRKAVEIYPFSTNVWLWLARVAESHDDRIVALQNVLAINPNHEDAKRRLMELRRNQR